MEGSEDRKSVGGTDTEVSAARAALEEAREKLEGVLEKAEEVVQEATGAQEAEMPP